MALVRRVIAVVALVAGLGIGAANAPASAKTLPATSAAAAPVSHTVHPLCCGDWWW